MNRFYCRFPTWPCWIAIFVFAGGAVRIGRSNATITIGFAILLVLFGLILRKIVRVPVVEISEDSILHGSAFAGFLPRRQVRLDEVSELVSSTSELIELRMRSGRRVKILLDEVRKAERQEAQSAIEVRLAGR